MWPPWRTPPPSPPSCSTETLFSAQRGTRQPSGARLVAPRRRPPELGPSPPPSPQPLPRPLPPAPPASRHASCYSLRARAGVALLPDHGGEAATHGHGPPDRARGPLPRHLPPRGITPALPHPGRAGPGWGSPSADGGPEAAARCIPRVCCAAPASTRALARARPGGGSHLHCRRSGHVAGRRGRPRGEQRGASHFSHCGRHRRGVGDPLPPSARERQAAPSGPRRPCLRRGSRAVVAQRQARCIHLQSG